MKRIAIIGIIILTSQQSLFSTISSDIQAEFDKFNQKFSEILEIAENIALQANKDLPQAAMYGATAVKNVKDGIEHIENSIIPSIKESANDIDQTQVRTPTFSNIPEVFDDLQQPVFQVVSMLKNVLEVLKYVTAMSYNLGASVQVLGHLVQSIPGAQDVGAVFHQSGLMLTSKLPDIFNTILDESKKVEIGIQNGFTGVEAALQLVTRTPKKLKAPLVIPNPPPPAINITPIGLPTVPLTVTAHAA